MSSESSTPRWGRVRECGIVVCTILASTGCAPDFSPDSFISPAESTKVRDAGPDASMAEDAALRPATDARSVLAASDAGAVEDGAEGGLSVSPLPAANSTVGCNLTGKWLMTERAATNAYGTKQNIYNWFYVELQQEGAALTFTRALACGGAIIGLPPIEIRMDDSQAWPSYMQHQTLEGRKGTSDVVPDGCKVDLEQSVIVRGGTVSVYRDLSVPLPTLEQKATATEPGWEDWDQDGKPGVSMRLSGAASGTLYLVTRSWSSASGSISAGANEFWLPTKWDQARSTLGLDGSPLFNIAGSVDPDQSLYFLEFARLSAEQAAGDDSALCARVRELAPTLNPRANK